jgi:hypothetical protein
MSMPTNVSIAKTFASFIYVKLSTSNDSKRLTLNASIAIDAQRHIVIHTSSVQ